MHHYKLRIKDPSGAEFEAEGPAEFITSEKTSFFESLKRASGAAVRQQTSWTDAETTGQRPDFWDKIINRKGDLITLRLKSPEINSVEAVLILMAANRALEHKEDIGAISLSKALKSSGYEPDRLDRLLSKEIKEGRATASGTKRNRTYRIVQKGLEKAYTAIKKIGNY